MKIRILSLLTIAVLFAGCKEEKGSLRLNFVGTFGEEPLVLGEALDYFPDYTISLLESDFYISEIALTRGSEIIKIADIDFVDFTNNNFNLDNAIAGVNLDYDDIDVGTYDGVRFGIGVPATENATEPKDYLSANPLSKSGYYWEAWDSYIFAKYAGQVEGQGFFFHTGTDPLFRTYTVNREIVISDASTSSVTLTLDHKTMMNENGQLYDIRAVPANHDPLTIGPLENFVNNYSSAFSFE